MFYFALLLLLTKAVTCDALLHRAAEPAWPVPADVPRWGTVKAFVLSLNDTRYERTRRMLENSGFNVTRVWPMPVDEPSLLSIGRFTADQPAKFRRSLSIQLSTRYALMSAAFDPSHGIKDDEYFMMFQDDATLDEHVPSSDVLRITHETAWASRDTGWFFLGLGCGWDCAVHGGYMAGDAERRHPDYNLRLAWQAGGTVFSRCCGLLAHAVGMYKWRAPWLFEELRTLAVRGWYENPNGYRYSLDTYLMLSCRMLLPPHLWPVVAGLNFNGHLAMPPRHCSPEADDGFGVFYQATKTLPSQHLGFIPISSPESLRAAQLASRAAARRGDGPHVVACPLQPRADETARAARLKAVYVITANETAFGRVQTFFSAAGVLVERVQPLTRGDTVVRSLAVHMCAGRRCAPAEDIIDELAHSMGHRLAWMRIGADYRLEDDEWAIVLEDDVVMDLWCGNTTAIGLSTGTPAACTPERLLSASKEAASMSAKAGLMYLCAAGTVRPATVAWRGQDLNVTYQRAVTDCVTAYGLSKWRATWLFDAARSALEDQPAFHIDAVNDVSVRLHLLHSMPLLNGMEDWPVMIKPGDMGTIEHHGTTSARGGTETEMIEATVDGQGPIGVQAAAAGREFHLGRLAFGR